MPKAEKALILRADFDAPMGLAHVQDQSGQTLTGGKERETLTDVGQGGVRRFVRQTGVASNPAN